MRFLKKFTIELITLRMTALLRTDSTAMHYITAEEQQYASFYLLCFNVRIKLRDSIHRLTFRRHKKYQNNSCFDVYDELVYIKVIWSNVPLNTVALVIWRSCHHRRVGRSTGLEWGN